MLLNCHSQCVSYYVGSTTAQYIILISQQKMHEFDTTNVPTDSSEPSPKSVAENISQMLGNTRRFFDRGEINKFNGEIGLGFPSRIIKNFKFLGLDHILFSGPLNILLLVVPFVILSWCLEWASALTFILSLISIAPLAERLGFMTEQMTLHTNATIGGLLNVTFGNATELIISVVALNKKYYRLVQLSLLGSILSNQLLVLGFSFLFGGLKHNTQSFSKSSGQINSTMFMLTNMALLFPSVLGIAHQANESDDKIFSRLVSLILLIMYCAYVYQEVTSYH